MGMDPQATQDRSLADLTRQLSLQTTELVRHEVELAKAELRVKGKRAGLGAGMFGGAGALGVYALGALTAAIIAGIAEALPVWASALIVAALYGAVAGILALRGKRKVQQATPPLPEETVQSVKEDVRYTKQRAQEARQ
jgi:MFS family permease